MYTADLDALTICYTDDRGERHDLNAGGEPCADLSDLLEFIGELEEAAAISGEDANDLRVQIRESKWL